MLRYALRRALWAIPTLFGISLVVFFVTTLIPDPTHGQITPALLAADAARWDALQAERRERFLDLPAFLNTRPADARVRATEALRHVVLDDAEAAVGAHELARLGGAALPTVLPQLDRLPPTARARVAVALAPIAVRMGEPLGPKLLSPDQATVYWTHFWEDRSLDFTEAAVARATHRLVVRSTELRERDLAGVDTFALHTVIPAMTQTDDREALRALAAIASHCTGRDGEIPFDADDDRLRRTIDAWQSWWRIYDSDYSTFDGLQRLAATILETRYGKWILSAASGRLGVSVRDGQPVLDKMRRRAPVTLAITLLSLFASYAVAVPFGALSAWWRGRAVDVALAVILFALYSFPTFWAAQLLADTFAPVHGGARAIGFRSAADWFQRILPAVAALSLGSFATLSRYQRAAALDVMRQEYVSAALAKGASPLRVMVVHVLRTAMIPTVTLAGLQAPQLLGGAFVVEEVFSVPGIGWETLRAVEARDSAWLVATILLAAIVTTAALVASDIVYGLLDPRLRESIGRRRGGGA